MELRLDGIEKSYDRGKTYAVKDFSVSFTPGVYGLLGPNGAGKSTLMNMITQNLEPDRGTITLDGEEIDRLGADYRALIGYMPQQQGVYEDFTGEKFLWYMAALKGLKKAEAGKRISGILEIVNLKGDRHKKLKSYSGGMKQRILIAQALLNDPKILIMDEPTAGLDPKERIRIRNFISEISKDKIVLIATHVVSDVEYISKEVLIMKSGSVVRKGTPQEVMTELEHHVFEVLVTPKEQNAYESPDWKIANMMLTPEKTCLRIVSQKKPQIGEVREAVPNLEDVYLYLVE
ncbi:MAG: ABC transporter ATP-binding protein [Clostridium sp.]|nr:ABC transporter ATP-binding protein [Clostridium sp.]